MTLYFLSTLLMGLTSLVISVTGIRWVLRQAVREYAQAEASKGSERRRVETLALYNAEVTLYEAYNLTFPSYYGGGQGVVVDGSNSSLHLPGQPFVFGQQPSEDLVAQVSLQTN